MDNQSDALPARAQKIGYLSLASLALFVAFIFFKFVVGAGILYFAFLAYNLLAVVTGRYWMIPTRYASSMRLIQGMWARSLGLLLFCILAYYSSPLFFDQSILSTLPAMLGGGLTLCVAMYFLI